MLNTVQNLKCSNGFWASKLLSAAQVLRSAFQLNPNFRDHCAKNFWEQISMSKDSRFRLTRAGLSSVLASAVKYEFLERIHRLKILTIRVKAGRAVRKYRAVKSDGD